MYRPTMDWELPDVAEYAAGRLCVLYMHSSSVTVSTFLREMTSWPPSWAIATNFILYPIWNDGALCIFEEVALYEEEEDNRFHENINDRPKPRYAPVWSMDLAVLIHYFGHFKVFMVHDADDDL